MTFQSIEKDLKICQGEETKQCKKCDFYGKEDCVRTLMISARHMLRDCYDMATFYAEQAEKEKDKRQQYEYIRQQDNLPTQTYKGMC